MNWLLLIVILILILLGAVIFFLRKKNTHLESDYYTFFVMGIIWLAVGIPQMLREGFSVFFIIGLVFTLVGLAHKDKWRKNYVPFSKLPRKKKQLLLGVLGSGVLILLVLVFVYYSLPEPCETPVEFLIQSNCPFGSAVIDDACAVVCPLTYHDLEESISHPVMCVVDSDCDCSERGNRTLACKCVNDACLSVEKFI